MPPRYYEITILIFTKRELRFFIDTCFQDKKSFIIYFTLVLCKALSLDNGVVSYNKPLVNGVYHIGTGAYIVCNPGYVSSDPQFIMCQPFGAWSSQITCTSISMQTSLNKK